MNILSSTFALFSVLVVVMLFSIWSNIQVCAQQSSSPTLLAPSVSKSVSPELKAKLCDPSNPGLKAVNTTEAHICGILKTVKPPLASSAAAPPTATLSSSSPPTQKTAVTKPTTTKAAASPSPKQQNLTPTNNIPQAKGTTVAPVSHSTATNALSSPSSIAPQVKTVNQHQQPQIRGINSTASQPKAVNEHQQPLVPLPIRALTKGTAGQNYTFAAASPTAAATSDHVVYLGYHPTSTNPTRSNSDLKHNDNHDSKSDTHDTTRSASGSSSKDKDTNDGSSAAKQKSRSTKPDRTDTSNIESSSKNKNIHNSESSSDHATDSGSNSKDKKTKSDDGSSKENDDSSDATSSRESSSIIENDNPSVILKSFNFKHSIHSDSSKSPLIIENDNPSVILKSFNFNR